MKKAKELFLKYYKFIFVVFAILYFMSFVPTITVDTSHYMKYVNIFEGLAEFNTWDIVRGPFFPALIYYAIHFFGKTTTAILILLCIFYILLLIYVDKILKKFLDKEHWIIKALVYIVTYYLLLFDPIIQGFYHVLLTEFVAMTFSVGMVYGAWKWLDISFFNKDEKGKYVLYTLLFSVLTVCAWFLKQPYVATVIFPVIIGFVISIIKEFNLKNILQRLVTVICCMLFLVCGIKYWNFYLESHGVSLKSDRNVVAGFGGQMIAGLNRYHIYYDYNDKLEGLIDKKDMKERKKMIICLRNHEFTKDTCDVIELTNGSVATTTAVKYIIGELFTNPKYVIKSYYDTYLAIGDLKAKYTEDYVVFSIVDKITWDYCHEICAIGYYYLNDSSNIYYMNEEYYSRVYYFEQSKEAPSSMMETSLNMTDAAVNRYKYSFIIVPFIILFLCVYALVLRIRKIKDDQVVLMLLLFVPAFLHIMVYSVLAANIDRYAIPAYLCELLGLILFICYFAKRILLLAKVYGFDNIKKLVLKKN